jgi:hypothetical protein
LIRIPNLYPLLPYVTCSIPPCNPTKPQHPTLHASLHPQPIFWSTASQLNTAQASHHMTTAVSRITPCPPGFSDHVYKISHGVEVPLRVWPAKGKDRAPWLFWIHGGGSGWGVRLELQHYSEKQQDSGGLGRGRLVGRLLAGVEN